VLILEEIYLKGNYPAAYNFFQNSLKLDCDRAGVKLARANHVIGGLNSFNCVCEFSGTLTIPLENQKNRARMLRLLIRMSLVKNISQRLLIRMSLSSKNMSSKKHYLYIFYLYIFYVHNIFTHYFNSCYCAEIWIYYEMNLCIYTIYIKKTYGFGLIFSLLIMILNKFDYKNVILLISFKKIRIYIIIFIILLVLLKKKQV